jgi:hypothetical protein
MPPGGATDQSDSDRDVAYCRAARRVRATHARRPARLYRELQYLGTRYTAAHRAPLLPSTPPSRAQAFAHEVAARLDGPVLRQSQRRSLLAGARKLGIGRFEANLLIAAVQHEKAPEACRVKAEPAAARSAWRFAPVAVALTVQGLIAWGAWHVYVG